MMPCVATCEGQRLTFLRFTLSYHEGTDLRVWQLEQFLGFVPTQAFKQPARSEEDSLK